MGLEGVKWSESFPRTGAATNWPEGAKPEAYRSKGVPFWSIRVLVTILPSDLRACPSRHAMGDLAFSGHGILLGSTLFPRLGFLRAASSDSVYPEQEMAAHKALYRTRARISL